MKRTIKEIVLPITRKTLVYFALFLLGWSIFVIWSVQEILRSVVERATKRAIAEECSRYEDFVKSDPSDSNTNEYAIARWTRNPERERDEKFEIFSSKRVSKVMRSPRS